MKSMSELVSLIACLGQISVDGQNMRDRAYLEDRGWVCLGAEFGTGEVHWTNLERGLAEGGPVTFYRALHIQKTKDACERNTGDRP